MTILGLMNRGSRCHLSIFHPMSAETSRLPSWSKSLWFHALLLGLVLVSLVPVVGLHGLFVNDEGAALAQATQLSSHGTWFFQNGFPAADPDGLAYPIDRATQSNAGFAPLLKNPTYALVLAGADRIGGRIGIALVGILGTVLAAVAAALLGRELRPGIELACLWAAGIASPLLFDSFIVLAHSLGAAGAGFAALGVIRLLRGGRWGNFAFVIGGLAWVVALRTEGALFGFALTAVVAVVVLRGRRRSGGRRRRDLLVPLVTAGATAVAFLINRLVTKSLAPNIMPSTLRPLPTFGLVDGRVNAFSTTWLMPGYGSGWRVGGPVLLVIFTVFTVIQMRRRPDDTGMLMLGTVGMWFGALFWVLVGTTAVVPGLLPAFPLLVAGAAAWRSSMLKHLVVLVLSATAVVFAIFVLATEYAVGGGAEWGSRYVAIGLPLVVPLIVVALHRLGTQLTHQGRRVACMALVPLVFAPAFVTVSSLRSTHQDTATLVNAVVTHLDSTVPGDGGKPVIVTDALPLGRLAWDHLDEARWLAASGPQLDVLLRRLHSAGIRQFLFVTGDLKTYFGPNYRIMSCQGLTSPTDSWKACIVEER